MVRDRRAALLTPAAAAVLVLVLVDGESSSEGSQEGGWLHCSSCLALIHASLLRPLTPLFRSILILQLAFI